VPLPPRPLAPPAPPAPADVDWIGVTLAELDTALLVVDEMPVPVLEAVVAGGSTHLSFVPFGSVTQP